MNATTRLAPGSGLLARRATALLYAPERDAELVEAFNASAPGNELQAMASTTVAAGFGVGPFVCLAWSSGVQVMAFGDVAVETDQPSLPMLSGAGSRTWVEHSFSPNGSAVIEVTGEAGDVDAATDLASGVALAGGFRLELVRAGGDVPSAPVEVAVDVEATVEPEPVDATTAIPLVAEVTVEPLVPEPVEAQLAAPEPPEPVATPAPLAPAFDIDDPAAALAAIQAAAVGADGEPIVPPTVAPPRRARAATRRDRRTPRCRRHAAAAGCPRPCC